MDADVMRTGSVTRRLAICAGLGLIASAWMAVTPSEALARSSSPVVPASGTASAIALPAVAPSSFHAASRARQFGRPLLTPDPAALQRARAQASDRAAATHPGAATTTPRSTAGPYTSVYNGNNMSGLAADGCCSPSDSTGDVGPSGVFVEMVNASIATFPPGNGGSLFLETFAGFPGACAFDPQIAWDSQGGRWLYAASVQIPASPTNPNCNNVVNDYLAFGWSRTSDPTDLLYGWCRYAINTGSNLEDFPKLGHDNNFITVGANVFTNFGNAGTRFVSAIIWAISKPAYGDTGCPRPPSATYFGGVPGSMLKNSDGSTAFTPVPADVTDSSSYGYIVAAHLVPSNKIMTWHLGSNLGSPVLSADGDVTVATYDIPPLVPQNLTGSCSTAGNCLDTLDGRLTQAIAHFDPDVGAETVWTQHGVLDTNAGTLSVERWYELIPGHLTPRQSGNISDPSQYIWNGAVSPSLAGNEAVIFYNEAAPASFVTYQAQSRNSLTPLGTFANPFYIGNSLGGDTDFTCGVNQVPANNAPCRWGDYSSARPDPNNTNAVWGVGMTAGMGTCGLVPCWQTLIAALTPGCGSATVGAGFFIRNNIDFNASSSGCLNPEYEFWLQYPDGTWSLKRPFSTKTKWTWDTTGYPVGDYKVHVWANQIGDSRASLEAVGEYKYTLMQPAPCATAGIGPVNPLAPAGSMVGFVAASTTCQAPIFEYWFQDLSGTWNLGRPFSIDPSWTWNTAGLAPGTYNVHVWANQQGDSTASLESYAAATATLTGCTSASISPLSVTQPAGTTVNLTASSSGCSSPQYEFWVGYPDGSWALKQQWGGPTFAWNTSGLAPGMYSVHVWANQAGASTATWEANGAASVALSICTSAALAPTNPNAAAGSMVALTASSTGCANPQYEFWVQYPNGTWSMQQPFSASATFNWSTAGLTPGTYNVHVWANNLNDPMATWEANGADTVTLTGCTSASLVPPSGTAVVGTPVNFTASSSGCTMPVYEFWLQYPNGTWHLMQNFNPGGAVWQWDTTGLPKGNYVIHVWANNQGADLTTPETYGTATYTLT
jgi:hypothetical protein